MTRHDDEFLTQSNGHIAARRAGQLHAGRLRRGYIAAGKAGGEHLRPAAAGCIAFGVSTQYRSSEHQYEQPLIRSSGR